MLVPRTPERIVRIRVDDCGQMWGSAVRSRNANCSERLSDQTASVPVRVFSADLCSYCSCRCDGYCCLSLVRRRIPTKKCRLSLAGAGGNRAGRKSRTAGGCKEVDSRLSGSSIESTAAYSREWWCFQNMRLMMMSRDCMEG